MDYNKVNLVFLALIALELIAAQTMNNLSYGELSAH